MSTCRESVRCVSSLTYGFHLDLQADPHLEAKRLAVVDAVVIPLKLALGIRPAAVLVHHRDGLALEGADLQRQRVGNPMQGEVTDDLRRLAIDEVRKTALVGCGRIFRGIE